MSRSYRHTPYIHYLCCACNHGQHADRQRNARAYRRTVRQVLVRAVGDVVLPQRREATWGNRYDWRGDGGPVWRGHWRHATDWRRQRLTEFMRK